MYGRRKYDAGICPKCLYAGISGRRLSLQRNVSWMPRPGWRPIHLTWRRGGTYTDYRLTAGERVTKSKFWIYAEQGIFYYRYLMRLVDGEGRGELLLAEDKEEKNIREYWEKGYDLPVEKDERKEAEADLRAALELTPEIYREADKGEASNVVLSGEVMDQVKEKIKTLGMPVTGCGLYSVMENWGEMEHFLLDAERGKAGTVRLYMVHGDGGIGRFQYEYDGKNLYVLAAKMMWGRDGTPMFTYISNTRIKEWRYTEKGYFCYEL